MHLFSGAEKAGTKLRLFIYPFYRQGTGKT
jgi:hypothetical protein